MQPSSSFSQGPFPSPSQNHIPFTSTHPNLQMSIDDDVLDGRTGDRIEDEVVVVVGVPGGDCDRVAGAKDATVGDDDLLGQLCPEVESPAAEEGEEEDFVENGSHS